MVLNLPGNDLGPDGQPLDQAAGFADRNLPGEAGRPPKGENTRAFPRGGGKLPAGSAARKPSGKALTLDEISARLEEIKAVTLENPPPITVGNKLPGERRPLDVLATQRTRDTDAITTAMVAELRDAVGPLERELLSGVEGKAFDPDGLVKRLRTSAAWKTFQASVAGIMERYAQQALSAASVHHESTADIDYEAAARALVYRKDGVRSITNTLKSEVAQKVGAVLKDGGGRAEVEAAVREAADFWRETKAETVALTEAVHAYNEGTLLAHRVRPRASPRAPTMPPSVPGGSRCRMNVMDIAYVTVGRKKRKRKPGSGSGVKVKPHTRSPRGANKGKGRVRVDGYSRGKAPSARKRRKR